MGRISNAKRARMEKGARASKARWGSTKATAPAPEQQVAKVPATEEERDEAAYEVLLAERRFKLALRQAKIAQKLSQQLLGIANARYTEYEAAIEEIERLVQRNS